MKVFALWFPILAWLFLSSAAVAQRPPLCDVDCSPDPGSGNYGGAIAARPKSLNARGYRSATSAKAGAVATSANGGPAILTVIGSQSFNYTIPILNLPGRNGLDLNLNLYYNSRVWDVDTVGKTATFNADRDFPSYGFRLDFGYIEYDSANNQYILTETDGTKRALPNLSGYNSNDGSFINYNAGSKILTYQNGTVVQYAVFPSQASGTQTLFRPIQIEDTNGNYISIVYVSGHDQLIQSVTDTLGRVIQFNYDSSNRLTSLTQALHPSGTKTYVTFSWGTVSLNYAFASPLIVSNSPTSGTSVNVITSCTYANGTGYRLTYGDWGIVKKIETLSSTGITRSYVSYNFPLASGGALSDAPAYTQETVSPDGTSTSNWNYAVTKNGTGVVTSMSVTDPNGNIAVSNLDATTGLLSSVQLQNSSGATQRSIAYTWAAVGTASSQLPATITTTLSDTGQQSAISYTYDANGNPTDIQEKDLGGQLKRDTAMTYAGGDYITKHILNLPTQITIKDGSASIFARTDLAYDSTTLSSVTGASQHDDTNFGTGTTTRGNLTSVIRYSNASAGSGGVTRTFNFDSLGNLILAQLDCCNQKTFSFSGGTQYAYPDSVVRGPTGLQFTSGYTWNFDTGLLTSSTDENGQTTNFQYDSMNRLTQTAPPSPAAALNVSFGDDVASPTATTSNTGNSLVGVQTFDGMGHLMEVDDKNSTTLVSSVLSSYDGIGQRIKASNPFGPSDTAVYTTFSYDPLGRLTQVSPPSGGSMQYQYSGNAVTINDPAGKQRKNITDALGRLIEVDEPGASFAGSQATGALTISGNLQSHTISGTYGTGSVTVSGSEAWTTYDPCVVQNGSNCPQNYFDYGSVSITVNGYPDSTGYGEGSTAASVASGLAQAINADGSAFVNASASNGVLYLTARQVGAVGNYTWQLSAQSNDTNGLFDPNGSFANPPTSGSLSGGADGSVVWDSGTVTVMIGSFTASASYSQSGNSTAAQVASALVSTGPTGLNRSGSPVAATVSGANITITYNTVGGSGNLSVSASSASNNTNYFPNGSFSGSTTLSGGQDAYSSGMAHPYATTYTYDPLDNLTAVSQAAGNFGGQVVSGQARNYSYDSLSRLQSATTPESGTVTNYYTNSTGGTCAADPSLVCRVQDARGIVKTLSYDAINRVSGISYSDSTPPVTYQYDAGGSAAFALDRLTKITEDSRTPANSQTFTYDNLGRIKSVSQVIDSSTYLVQYGYNAVSQPTSITYPTNRVVSQNYDAIGRPSSIADGTTTYLSGLSFNAAGEALGFTYGNGVQAALGYNDHLQISTLRYFKSGNSSDVLNLSYDYGSSNNGQIQAIHYNTSPGAEDSTKSQYFTYDLWSRLSAAHTGTVSSSTPGTWSLTWDYDRLGNRLHQNLIGGNATGTSIGQPQFTVDVNTNRITNTGFAYDANGNLTADGTNTYAYDGANRMTQLNTNTATYAYFGALRIKKVAGSTTTVYIYSGSEPIVEYASGSVSKEYVYSGSKLLATLSSGSATYHHPDHLSNRAETDSSGNVLRTYGQAPFGESWYETGTADKWKYSSYERDTESGLDYAQFRYYASAHGRFTRPDLLAGDTPTPQSLNRYAYVLNDPVNSVDPSGLLRSPLTQFFPPPGYGGGVGGLTDPFPSITSCFDFFGLGAEGEGSTYLGTLCGPTYLPFVQHPGGGGMKKRKKRTFDKWKKLNDCIKKIFGKDAAKIPPQTPDNAPAVNATMTSLQIEQKFHISVFSGTAGKSNPFLGPNGTEYLAADFIKGATNPNFFPGLFVHELGVILDVKLYPDSEDKKYGKHHGDSNPDTNEGDDDTGAALERCVFGHMQNPNKQ